MKIALTIVIAALTIVKAEVPRNQHFRPKNRFSARQELAPQGLYPPAIDAPYPVSGWKPSGPQFELPSRPSSQVPSQVYGEPSEAYNAPLKKQPEFEPDAENIDVSGSDRNQKLKSKPEKSQKQEEKKKEDQVAAQQPLLFLPSFQKLVLPQYVTSSVLYASPYAQYVQFI